MCLCACFSLRGADATSYQDWQFTNSANPASPTVATNSSGMASATMVVLYAGLGWQADLPGLGTQTGLWDLGLQNPDDLAHDTRGRVTLSIPVPTNGSSYSDLNLRVVQFVDGFFYTGELTFSIPGVTNVGRTVVEVPGGLPGSWVEDEFRWRLAPSPEQVSLSITGAIRGTILDRIRVDTTSPQVTLPELTIISAQKQGQILTINWIGGLPPYQVYATSNLLNPAAWRPIGPAVSATSADIPIEGTVGFVKVGGSN
jgi:hypothetical protein